MCGLSSRGRNGFNPNFGAPPIPEIMYFRGREGSACERRVSRTAVGVWIVPSVIFRFSRMFGGRAESWLRRWEGRRDTSWIR